jgi:hypothetical protein
MPQYIFHCHKCKVQYEKHYGWKDRDGINVIDDPDFEVHEECGEIAEHLPYQRTLMKPDRFWAGVYDDRLDIYTTSECRHREYMKQNELLFVGDRTDREGITKMAEQGQKDKDAKAEKAVQKEIIDTLAWKDEWGITGTVKERNRKEREIRRLESECPADVMEDSAFK